MKTLSLQEADNLALRFRSENGLSQYEPIGAKTILRKLDIQTMYSPLSEKSYGLSIKAPDGQMFIMINSNSTRGRQHFSIAHELYHLFYDENPQPHLCRGVSIGEEKNANRFAAALLMPSQGLIKLVSKDEIKSNTLKLSTIIRMEQLFQVSRSTLLYRLLDLKWISESRFEELIAMSAIKTARDYGQDISLYKPGNENLLLGDYGEKILRAYENDLVSESHFLELSNSIPDAEEN